MLFPSIENKAELESLELIAEGGMSLIYKAIQSSMNRQVVLKVLKPQIKDHPEIWERFRREAQAMGTVLHQNIAHVYDFEDAGADSYLLMEYIEGADLSLVLSKYGALSPQLAIAIALQMLSGLQYIHDRDYLHRDIKPSNIRLTKDGDVKLMDFGIALCTTADGLTRPGTMVGSPCYLSPEQILGEKLTPSSDLFLVGICLYEMLTGSRPFVDQGDASVFRRIREADYVPIRKMRTQVPPGLARIVGKLLQKKPDQRFQSANQVATELKRVSQTLSEVSSLSADKRRIKNFLIQEAFIHSDQATDYEPLEFDWPNRRSKKKRTRAIVVLLALIMAFGAGFLLANSGLFSFSQTVEKTSINSDIKAIPKSF